MATALAIWGTAGHARVATTVARLQMRWDIVGYLDDVYAERWGTQFCGAPVLGGRDALDALRRRGVRHLFLGFGANLARRDLAEELENGGFEFATLIHPSAVVADDVQMEPGVFVGPGAIVNADARVRKQSIINSGAIVEHEVRLGRAVHVGPRACLAGSVSVGDCAWVGLGAIVRDKLEIGEHAMVGMGAVVTRSVPARSVVVGCPAKPLQRVSP
jgi:sugar O-acyltransferase (sialic acid O-acetyltransferase NeuD family)